jgi:iron complex transport system ATP-binding protein
MSCDRDGVIIRNLGFRYSGGFSLSLDEYSFFPGEVTAILGPNGSGKSTLFSLIRGRLQAGSGTIRIHGKDISRVPGRERAGLVGLVPQVNQTPFGFSVEDVVKMGGYRYSRFQASGWEEESSLLSVLEQTDLISHRFRRVDSLSGGEYQRVLLARVLLQDPRVLLLDEPANHLDLRHQETLLRLIRDQARQGKTIVAVLHDVNQALLHADKVVLLKEGRCAASGPVSEVLTPGRIREVYDTSMDFYYPSWQEGSPILGPGRGKDKKG